MAPLLRCRATLAAGLACLAPAACSAEPGGASPGPPTTREDFASLDELPPLVEPRTLAPALADVARALQAGRLPEALAAAEAHAAQAPGDAQAAFLVGLAHAKADNHDPARTWFERALALAPQDVLAYDYLGQSLLRLGELEAAGRAFAAYRARDPRDPRSHYGSALVALEHGDDELASRHLERAVLLFDDLKRANGGLWKARSGELAQTHARLGDLAFAVGDYEGARTQLERAVALAPRSVSPYYKLGLVYRRLGEDVLAQVAEARFRDATTSEGGR